jgi:hypothetical protein
MSKGTITTDEFHNKLVQLVSDVAAKAIRGETSGCDGMSWEDASKFIELVNQLVFMRVYPSAERDGDGTLGEFSLSVSLCSGDVDDFDTHREQNFPLSLVVRDGAEYIYEGVDYVREYRDYIAKSVSKLDEWLEHQGA